MRIFISYADKDGKEYAKTLNGILRERGHDSFFADHDILPSETVWDIISGECLTRKLVIFVATPAFKESKGQKEEYDLVVSNHIQRMALIDNDVGTKELFEFYPFLKPPKAEKFDNKNFVDVCKKLAVDLVRLSDKREVTKIGSEYKFEALPVLSQDDLDSSEITNCIDNLRGSYEHETIIPYVCRVSRVKEDSAEKYVTIGFNHLLPRKWFFPKEKQEIVFSNDFMFQEDGRNIALEERRFLQESILREEKVPKLKIGFSPDKIYEVIDDMNTRGFCPNFVFPTIEQYLQMNKWHNGGSIRYDYGDYGRLSNEIMVINKYELQIVPPLGNITRKAILLNNNAVNWRVILHPQYGALSIALGNSELYPTKFAQEIAFTRAKCEINPNGVSVIT